MIAVWAPDSVNVDLQVREPCNHAALPEALVSVDAQVHDRFGAYVGEILVWTDHGATLAALEFAVLYYRRGPSDGDGNKGALLRAFVEVDRATMGPERLAAKLGAYTRLHAHVPQPAGRRSGFLQERQETWRRSYPLFPRLLFVLDNTGPAGIATRISALHAAAGNVSVAAFLREVPALAAPLVDLLQDGPSAPVWRPLRNPDQRVGWMHSAHP